MTQPLIEEICETTLQKDVDGRLANWEGTYGLS
jgi:hypothetical protein